MGSGVPFNQAQVRKILAPFRKKSPDGKLMYSKADRRRVYQLLLVTLIPPGRFDKLRPELQNMAGELSVTSGAARASSPKEAMASLAAHFKKNPPHPQLMADLNKALATLVKELEDAARRSAQAPVDPSTAGMAPPPPAMMGARSMAGLKMPGSSPLKGALDDVLAARRLFKK